MPTATSVQYLDRRPNPGPQTDFLRSGADIVIYGGAAGGGKTAAVCLEGLRHAPNTPGFVGVFLRRERVDITQKGGLCDAAKAWWLPRGAKINHTTLTFTWPGGGAIQLGSAQRESDVHAFDGAEICLLVFDEIQHFEESQFWYLLSRNRSTCGVRPYVRATCNPSADSWLAKFLDWWIDEDGFAMPERSGLVRWMVRRDDVVQWATTPDEMIARYPDCRPQSVSFVAAKLTDNPVLMDRDPDYIAKLDNLPRVERARLLGGNWKVRAAAGDYFRRRDVSIVDAPAQGDLVKVCRHWDLAGSEPSETYPDPDFTAGLKIGQYRNGRWVVLDLCDGQWRSNVVEDTLVSVAKQDGHGVQISLPQDGGSAGKSYAATLAKLLVGFRVAIDRETGDKITRCLAVSAQWQAHNVDVVRAPWNERFFAELEAFPTGIIADARGKKRKVHDDRVDALSGAFNCLTKGSTFMSNFGRK